MSQTAGIAGWNFGNGRVAAFTKAINYENLGFSGNDQELFTRLFLNTCLWACRNFRAFGVNSGGRRIAIVRTDNQLFDERLYTLFNNMQFFSSVDLVSPWYENHGYSEYYYDLHILIPSYNAFDGVRMPDARQAFLLDDVYYRSAGIVIAEWFHLLQSIPSKRSFAFQNASQYNFQKPYSLGLIDLSPLEISRNYLVYTEADEILYSQEVYNDSMSATIPNSFTLFNQNLDTPFKGHIVQIANIKDGATIYWSTDVPAIGTTTTTTTTTLAPVFDEIKLKVFDLNLINTCGPQKLYLTGENKDFFTLEGNELFLTKNISEPTTLSVNVVAEDYFETERFNRVLENITIDFVECFAPISLPKDGSGPAFSYRLGGEGTKKIWGQFFPTGVITPFTDYAFIGRGISDDPTIAWVGGQHNDANALWMQINNGGEITATLTASMEYSYTFNFYSANSYSIVGDIGKLFFIQNDLESNIKPEQHFGSLLEMDYQNQYITELSAASSDGSNSFSFNVEDPNALDDDGNRIRGDAFLVLYYQKDIMRTERQDRIFANIYFGQTTTTPPPEFDFTVLIENNVPNTSTNVTSLKFTSIATSSPVPFQRFYLTIDSGLVLGGLTISDNSDLITTGFRQYNSNSWEIDVTLSQMPIGGGLATIVLNGNTQTTTTTTTQSPETYPVIVEIFNRLNLVRLNGVDKNESIRLTQQATENALITFVVNYTTELGYEYRDFNKPSVDIISQSVANMVSLTGDNPISVSRGSGSFNNDGNTNGRVFIPVRVPQLGGRVELDLIAPEPVAVTTTTTTTTLEPCDFSIYIICQQVLDCIENANGDCVPSSRSYQRLLYSTCCDISDTEIMTKIRQYKNVPSNATLESIYGPDCPSTNFEFLAPCLPKDLDGKCQETLHNEIIDVIPCFSSFNPLP